MFTLQHRAASFVVDFYSKMIKYQQCFLPLEDRPTTVRHFHFSYRMLSHSTGVPVIRLGVVGRLLSVQCVTGTIGTDMLYKCQV